MPHYSKKVYQWPDLDEKQEDLFPHRREKHEDVDRIEKGCPILPWSMQNAKCCSRDCETASNFDDLLLTVQENQTYTLASTSAAGSSCD